MRLRYEQSVETHFKQRKRSPMIEEGDEDAQNNIGDP